MTIDLLCRVVDNYGDIGVVYRLTRSLKSLYPENKYRLIVDDLFSFKKLCPKVNTKCYVQEIEGFTVVYWKELVDSLDCIKDRENCYKNDKAVIIIECFACGRPLWLEDLVFDPNDNEQKLIINLEYLSAEPYADEMHMMKGLTRAGNVKKYMFLPGFTDQTGGLVLDSEFIELKNDYSSCLKMETQYQKRKALLQKIFDKEIEILDNSFWISIFSYERDYSQIAKAIKVFTQNNLYSEVVILAASGRSQNDVIKAFSDATSRIRVISLPFLSQKVWDEVLFASDFNIVRGEDSLSRAALVGRPFLWQAYPQDEEYHLVKVNALLDRMKGFFDEDFVIINKLFCAFNVAQKNEVNEELFLSVLNNYKKFSKSFINWSLKLEGNGNLASKLMTFIMKNVRL